MKKRYRFIWGLLTAFCFFSSCSDHDDLPGSNEADFVSYSIRGYNEKAVIDAAGKTVFLQLPETVKSGEGMCPEFEVSPGAVPTIHYEVQKSGAENMDFSNLQLYTITSADQSASHHWRVTVTNNNYTSAYGLGNFLTASWSNNGPRADGFYRQQQHTGLHADENCGPACAVMAALYADASFSGTVEQAREEYPTNRDGGTWWYDNTVYDYLESHGISPYWGNYYEWEEEEVIRTLCDELEKGSIAVCCLDISWITEQRFPSKGYHADKFYPTSGNDAGHFIVVKGYRVVSGTTWFEVHDPWGLDMTYEDGTPMGANRYYKAHEVASSLLYWNNGWVVLVPSVRD